MADWMAGQLMGSRRSRRSYRWVPKKRLAIRIKIKQIKSDVRLTEARPVENGDGN